MSRVDVVVTGDSLGMHMAIALGKHVVAFFGPTSAPEIDLYGRGVKLVSDMACSPCWSPRCDEPVPCSMRVPPITIADAVRGCLNERARVGARSAVPKSDGSSLPHSGR